MRLMYGSAVIKPAAKRNRTVYSKRKPHFFKCACPGCQNFFKSIKPYRNELEALLAPLGVVWDKPDSITVLSAKGGEISYRADYTFYGEGQCPPLWVVDRNELGTINLRNPDAVCEHNERLSLVFESLPKGRLRLEVYIRLPWIMETMNCIYDEEERTLEKKLPSRPVRVYRAAKHILNGLGK